MTFDRLSRVEVLHGRLAMASLLLGVFIEIIRI